MKKKYFLKGGKLQMPLLRETINQTNKEFNELINNDNKKLPMPIIGSKNVIIEENNKCSQTKFALQHLI